MVVINFLNLRHDVLAKAPRRKESPLQVPPIIELQYHCTVPDGEWCREVVVSINNVQIGSRFISPLEPCVEVYIFLLPIVLKEGCKKELVRHRYINPRTYMQKWVMFRDQAISK